MTKRLFDFNHWPLPDYCQIYDCSSLKNTLQLTCDNVWLNDELSGPLLDTGLMQGTSREIEIPIYTTPSAAAYLGKQLLPDYCNQNPGASIRYQNGNAAFLKDFTAETTTPEGMMGGLIEVVSWNVASFFSYKIANSGAGADLYMSFERWPGAGDPYALTVRFGGGGQSTAIEAHYILTSTDPNFWLLNYKYENVPGSPQTQIKITYQMWINGIARDPVPVEFMNGSPGVTDSTSTRFVHTDGSGTDDHYKQYCFHNYEYASQGTIDAINAAYLRNFAAYTDPNPSCVKPICKVYVCSAFSTALSGVMDEVWPMDDPYTGDDIGNTTQESRNIINPTHTLGWFGTELNHKLGHELDMPAIMDGCGDELLGSKVNNGVRYDSTVGSGAGLTNVQLSGTFAQFVGASGNPVGLIWRHTPDAGAVSRYVQLSTTGTNILIGFVNAQPSHNILGALPSGLTNHVLARWTLSAGGALHIEIYVNFLLVDIWNTTVAAAWAVNNGNIIIGAGTLNAGMYQNTVGYSSSYISGSDIAGLKAAFDQNQSAYVDPNTNCRSV